MSGLVTVLRSGLTALADPAAAEAMQAYMKSPMPFHGVPKPQRQRVLAEALRRTPLDGPEELRSVAVRLWDEATVREERYLALSLVDRYARWTGPEWVPLLRAWIVEGAWWDFTDEIASRRLGPMLRAHPADLTPVLRAWATDDDRWLRRTSVIVQLQSKDGTDLDLLIHAIEANLGDPDFFLRKGIGWALRQYAKSDPGWVRAFVAGHPELSRKEALRHLT